MDQHQQTSRHPKSSLTVETSHWTSSSLDSMPLQSSSRPWFPNEMRNLLLSLDHWATVQFFFSTFSYPISSFQSTLHLICFDTALCRQPPLSAMTLCDLPSLWRVSMIVFWTIAKSAVFPHCCGFKEQEIPIIYTVWMVIYWNSNVNILIFWDTDFWLLLAVSSNHQN